VPFLCVFFYETVKNRNKTALLFYNNHTFKERLIGLKNPGVFAGVFFVLGYMILSVILARIFFFKSYETSSQFLADPNDFLDHAGKVFMGLLELFGFTFNASVLSLTGLCNITAFLFLFLLIIKAKNYLKNGGSPEKTFVIKFICAGFFFNTFVFVFSLAAFDDYNRFLLRYYIPTTIFFIPLAALVLNDNFKSFSSKLTVALIVFHVFVTGANVIPQYVRFLETGTQTKTPAAGFLKDRGYKLGLATFWNSAVMQEITDGKVQFATVELYNDEKTPVSFYRYFTPKEYERKMNEAGFILLSKEEYETYKTGAYFINREIKYEDQWFVVLEL
jgi:hypothetical protein